MAEETKQIIENKHPDSIEYRIGTGKAVKVSNDPEGFKEKLNNALEILREADQNE